MIPVSINILIREYISFVLRKLNIRIAAGFGGPFKEETSFCDSSKVVFNSSHLPFKEGRMNRNHMAFRMLILVGCRSLSSASLLFLQTNYPFLFFHEH